MSTLEKNLYKNLRVESQRVQSAPLTAGTYRGISTVNPNTREFKLFDLGLIKQDIINHFHIRLGEKLENPSFGTIIWDVLYEPLTDSLKDAVVKNVTDIINYDPRVNVTKVTVDSFEFGIQVECELIYLDYSISEQLRFEFDRDAGIE
jgi:phage baseplate assembly protein W